MRIDNDLRSPLHPPPFVVIPTAPDLAAVVEPIKVIVGIQPIAFQYFFQIAVPVRITRTVVRPRTVTEAIRILQFLVSQFALRQTWVLPCGQHHRVIDARLSMSVHAAEIMLRLIPIALKGGFNAAPCRVVIFMPPVWISML